MSLLTAEEQVLDSALRCCCPLITQCPAKSSVIKSPFVCSVKFNIQVKQTEDLLLLEGFVLIDLKKFELQSDFLSLSVKSFSQYRQFEVTYIRFKPLLQCF